ncbi:ROK family protein [Clostridium sp. AL.422]|uniref:ROK family protein n=1 Tax=Clostridium TaxID=1485 RepID=UPI00293DA72F|nr:MULTISPECIES: ROK family protein [unclassified Clostridium]MDV4150723.1 ROK family protein [Clostridium sp. AL.422]
MEAKEFIVGIDIGGTNIRAALLDKERNIVDKIKIKNEVDNGPEYNLSKITTHINENWLAKGIIGVGVGCPGPLNIKTGTILKAPNLRGWDNFNVKKFIEDNTGLKTEVNNDANVAGLAEAMIGVAKGAESTFYITVSTGVGGALIIDNKIINGANSFAGEICNLIINEDKYSHSGLVQGGLEGQCSGPNIARIASEKLGKSLDTPEVFELYKENNTVAQDIINELCENLSKGISNIISVVDPEVIVLGGSVILFNNALIEIIKEKVREKVINKEAVDIRIAEIGDDAGLRGAGLLINEECRMDNA